MNKHLLSLPEVEAAKRYWSAMLEDLKQGKRPEKFSDSFKRQEIEAYILGMLDRLELMVVTGNLRPCKKDSGVELFARLDPDQPVET